MTKQEFIDKYHALNSFYDKQERLGCLLHESLLDGHSIVVFGNSLADAYIELLSLASGIDKDCIENLLYEGGTTYYKAGSEYQPYNVSTPEELWDFFKENEYA